MTPRALALIAIACTLAWTAVPLETALADPICIGCKFNKIGPSSSLPCLSVTTTTFTGLSGSCVPYSDGCEAEPCFVNMRAKFQNNCPGTIYINKKTGQGCTSAGEIGPGEPYSPTFYGSVRCGDMKIYRAYTSSGAGCGAGNSVGQVGFICTACLAGTAVPDGGVGDPEGDPGEG